MKILEQCTASVVQSSGSYSDSYYGAFSYQGFSYYEDKSWGRCSKCFGTGTRSRKSEILTKSSNADSNSIAAPETQVCNAIQQYGKTPTIEMELI